MKKLIMALGTVAIAAGLQAATYNWSVTSSSAVFDGWNSTAAIGKAWSDATAQSGLSWYFISTAVVSQGDLLSDLRGTGKITDYTVLASGTTGTDGKVAYTAFTADTGLVQGDGKMYAYFAVFSDDEQSLYLSATSSVAANTSGGQADYTVSLNTSKVLRDKDGTTAYGNPGWYAIPEPTSGLLMLLGMAGLALRRRRA